MPVATAERPATRPQTFHEKCIASIDAKLAEMPTAEERLKALGRAKVKFIALFDQFADRVDAGREPEFGETAFDYATLLADISIRIGREARR